MPRYCMIILPLLLLTAGCGADGPVAPVTYTGLYRTTTFIIPNEVDGPDDIHAKGGFIEIRLHADRSMQWTLYMPLETGDIYMRTSSSYTISGDTLYSHFNHSGPWFMGNPLLLRNGELHSRQFHSLGPFKLVVKKVNERKPGVTSLFSQGHESIFQ